MEVNWKPAGCKSRRVFALNRGRLSEIARRASNHAEA
jgi:hypothetical protein